jgi:multisubunit Na+/H+ antiporter MnhC subunit
MTFLIGAAFLAAGIALFVLCLPGRDGRPPRLLKSEVVASLVPVLILSLVVLGVGLLYASVGRA